MTKTTHAYSGDVREGIARLNDVERETLALLANGHTVKSIATLTGRSIASINERLREARRKTGLSSSRELARLLEAQKNRDNKIAVHSIDHGDVVTNQPRPATSAWLQTRTGVVIMSTLLGASVVAALVSVQVVPSAQPVASDPVLDAVLPPDAPGANQLHRQLRSEARDATWASRTEQVLQERLLRVHRDISASQAFRVICGSTMCEVTGSIPEVAGKPEIDRWFKELQGPELNADYRTLDLSFLTGMFTTAKQPKRTVYIGYLKREKNSQTG